MTPEELKALAEKVWQWCGFKKVEPGWVVISNLVGDYHGSELPTLDMNNFWRWAVPKLLEMGLESVYFYGPERDVNPNWGCELTIGKCCYGYHPDPGYAAFKAVENLIDQEAADGV